MLPALSSASHSPTDVAFIQSEFPFYYYVDIIFHGIFLPVLPSLSFHNTRDFLSTKPNLLLASMGSYVTFLNPISIWICARKLNYCQPAKCLRTILSHVKRSNYWLHSILSTSEQHSSRWCALFYDTETEKSVYPS